ncbi:SDR family oxidoreductase [Sinorhizobium sp. BG8]|uniref:SDR family oxidoreductase n=1 Tax=Sinorhizobium sp. BG8 TaxID=2613773 RepID=UPI00193E9680|nr:SDR family oxidoreductase [Sinorhizobium sp. BG8]QRM55880.1 SDR family oxidoreductase [Sinorhizobium sp. BG8]
MPDTFLITGAAGKLGRLVIEELLASGKVAPASIVAASRDLSKLSDLAAKGVTVRTADFNDPASLDSAFQGISKALIISTDALGEPGLRLAQHQAAVAAAKKAGVRHILYTSMPQPDDSLVAFAGDHLGTEKAIKATGIPHTLLRNGWYMENLFLALPHALQTGKWYTSAGQGRIAHIARADVAAAIAGALLSATEESRTYTLTGSETHTTEEIAALASAATGKSLEVVHLTDEQLAAGLEGAGLPGFLVPILVSFDANCREGKIAMATGDAETLSGRKPKSLEAFIKEQAAALAG